MGMDVTYFLAASDAEAAKILETSRADALGLEHVGTFFDPAVLGASLVVELTGCDPVAAMSEGIEEPFAATEDYQVLVARTGERFRSALAGATDEELVAACQAWSQAPEWGGGVSADELSDAVPPVAALARRATAEDRPLYVFMMV